MLPANREEKIYGSQIFQESIRQGRPCDEEAQGRHAEKRPLRQEGIQSQAGDRDRTFRSAGGRQEGAEEEGREKNGEEKNFEEEEGKEVEALTHLLSRR